MIQNISYWEKTAFLEHIDFAIVGSGIVGLNAAINLKERYPKAKVVIFERGVFPAGASTKNAGFACFGSVSELIEDLEIIGADALLTLVEKRWKGLQKMRNMLGDQMIDYQQFGGYELFFENDQHYQKCFEFLPFLNKNIAAVTGLKETFKTEKEVSKFGFGKVKKIDF